MSSLTDNVHSRREWRSGETWLQAALKKNLAIFHCETWKAQYVQQSSPFKSSLSVRDKHAAAFRDDSRMYYAQTREEEFGRGRRVPLHPFSDTYPVLLRLPEKLHIFTAGSDQEEPQWENKDFTKCYTLLF